MGTGNAKPGRKTNFADSFSDNYLSGGSGKNLIKPGKPNPKAANKKWPVK